MLLNSAYFNQPRYQILVYTGNFEFLDHICPEKGISSLKQKKWTSLPNSAYLTKSKYKISADIENFDLLDQIYPKKLFLV